MIIDLLKLESADRFPACYWETSTMNSLRSSFSQPGGQNLVKVLNISQKKNICLKIVFHSFSGIFFHIFVLSRTSTPRVEMEISPLLISQRCLHDSVCLPLIPQGWNYIVGFPKGCFTYLYDSWTGLFVLPNGKPAQMSHAQV